MTQNQVALRDETVPAPIQEMGQNYGLAVVEMQQVRVMGIQGCRSITGAPVLQDGMS